jgi:hypothetical protein
VSEADLVIAVPSRGNCRVEWASALKMLEPPVNYSWALRFITGEDVDDARNGSVLDAREMGAKYLMFIDDDTLIPNQGLRRLVYLMENHPDWDLLSGVYVTKTDPPQTLVFREGNPGPSWDWKFNEQFPITGCGMGCCLIRMSAFEKVEEPWFKFVRRSEGKNHSEEGEDLYFCRKLEEAGGTMMADGGLLCGHINKQGAIFSIPADSLPIRNGDMKCRTIIDATETLSAV